MLLLLLLLQPQLTPAATQGSMEEAQINAQIAANKKAAALVDDAMKSGRLKARQLFEKDDDDEDSDSVFVR